MESKSRLHSGYMALLQAKKKDELHFEEVTPYVTTVTLNNPRRMNHLTLNMLYLMLEKLVQWSADKEKAPTAIIMEGEGEISFCSGGDMTGLYDCYNGTKPKYY
jgi:enoyl-CoA hydratase/carnithine racemase